MIHISHPTAHPTYIVTAIAMLTSSFKIIKKKKKLITTKVLYPIDEALKA